MEFEGDERWIEERVEQRSEVVAILSTVEQYHQKERA
jgi:hypothetical protein